MRGHIKLGRGQEQPGVSLGQLLANKKPAVANPTFNHIRGLSHPGNCNIIGFSALHKAGTIHTIV
jgi:hypothetical protein